MQLETSNIHWGWVEIVSSWTLYPNQMWSPLCRRESKIKSSLTQMKHNPMLRKKYLFQTELIAYLQN